MKTDKQTFLKAICDEFNIYGDYLVAVPFGTGHINDTYQVTYDQGGVRLHYTLQKINHNVFGDPVKVMENIDRITTHILSRIAAGGRLGQNKRTIRLLKNRQGLPYYRDNNGDYWRCYIFIERARSYDVLADSQQAYMVARTFADFQLDLTTLPGGRLHETIPDFHNTPKRLADLEQAIAADVRNRVKEVSEEIDFIMERKAECSRLMDMHRSGYLPERITHNDTKINNILIDDVTGEAICVIDLDTVMPGLVHYDFGDMIRTATSPAEEDEQDLSLVTMRFEMYEALLKGYLSRAKEFLTPDEKAELPFSGKLITLEIGIRFLTDYLSGDKYFKIKHRQHNLDRCRTQLELVRSIEAQFDQMRHLADSL